MLYCSLLIKSKRFFCLLIFISYEGKTQNQKPVLTLPIGRPNAIMDFSKDGKLLVTGSPDNSFIVWDARTGFIIRRVNIGKKVQQVLITPNGTEVITVTGRNDQNCVLQKWDLQTGKLLMKLPFIASTGLQFLHGSGYLLVPDYSAEVSGKKPNLLEVFANMSDSEEYEDSLEQVFEERMAELVSKGEVEEDFNDPVKIADYQKKAIEVKMELLSGKKRNISIIDSKMFKPIASLDLSPEHIKLLYYNNTEYFITADERQNTFETDNKIAIWGIKEFISQKGKIKPAKEFRVKEVVNMLATSPGNSFFVTGSGKNDIELWQIDKDSSILKLKPKGNELYEMTFSPGGDILYVYSGSFTGHFIEAWNTATLKQTLSLQLPARYAGKNIHLSPDGNYVLLHTTNALLKLSPAGDSIGQFSGALNMASRFGFGENDESIVVKYNDSPNFMSPAILRTLEKDAEESAENEATEQGRVLSKEEKKKIAREKVGELNAVSSIQPKSFTLNWNLLSGGAVPGRFLSTGHKTTSGDNSYMLLNGKFESPVQNASLLFGKKKTGSDMENEEDDEEDPEEAEALEFMMDPQNGFTNILFSDSLNGPVTLLVNRKTKDTISLISIDSTDWVMLLKNGYYMTSKNGARSLSYTRGLEVFPFEQFDIQYNRPDLLLKAIGKTTPSLIEAYRNAYVKRVKKMGIDTSWFKNDFNIPEADFVNRDKIGYEQKTGKLGLAISAGDDKTFLDRFNIWVNDVPVFGRKGKSIKDTKSGKLNTTIEIMLSQGRNRIETSVINANGVESYRTPLFVNYIPDVPSKEKVYFIGIGISLFSDTSHNLRYCEKDIRDLSQKLKEKHGSAMEADLLFNEEVTIDNIKALKQKLMQTTEDDKVIIAYSGHGLLSSDYDYYLSTFNVNFDKPELNGLPYDELENLVDGIKARQKLMLIDACHSGELDKEELQKIAAARTSLATNGIIPGSKGIKPGTKSKLGMKNSFELMQELFVNVGRGTGTTIISAATGTQFALERGDLKNGVFTYSILELLKLKNIVTVNELKQYLNKRVYELTNGLQQPVARNEIMNTDWKL